MKIGIPKETAAGETRVAAVPETVKRMVKEGVGVVVQSGAGEGAFFTDEQFREAGAEIVADAAGVYESADVVVKVATPDAEDELEGITAGTILIAPLAPRTSPVLVAELARRGITSFALDTVPRITRAQSMDILSSMSTIAGYKAALLAAGELAKMLPMMMTAAGTIRPASALVIGAGVAGLQAIATVKRLGAVVTGVDVRPAVQEQVESLGAKFVAMAVEHAAEDAGGYASDLGAEFYRREQEILAPHVKQADAVIATALIPGRPAPVLITREMVEQMKAGSVIVDLAAGAGGNCTLAKPDQRVRHEGVTILGPTNLPASLPIHASLMFARNVATFLKELIVEGEIKIDMDNEVIRGTLITHEGKVVPYSVYGAPEGSEVES